MQKAFSFPSSWSLLGGLLSLSALASCNTPNPLYCDRQRPCSDSSQVCDSATNTCHAACKSNDACPSGYCVDGGCLLRGEIAYVDNRGGKCVGIHAGSADDPYCGLKDAFVQRVILVAPSAVPYSTALGFDGSQNRQGSYLISAWKKDGEAGGPPTLQAQPGQSILVTANGDLSLTVDGIDLDGAGGTTPAVMCDSSGVLAVLNSHIHDADIGISVRNCALTLDGDTISKNRVGVTAQGGGDGSAGLVIISNSEISASTSDGVQVSGYGGVKLTKNRIHDNRGQGLQLQSEGVKLDQNVIASNDTALSVVGSGYVITNNFVVGSTAMKHSGSPAVALSGSDGVFGFNTVAANQVSGAVISCSEGSIQSSIVWGNRDDSGNIAAIDCALRNVVVDGEEREGAILKDPAFADLDQLDVHLVKNDPANLDCCVDKITGGFMGLAHDFDGDPRPLGAGSDIGADEVQ